MDASSPQPEEPTEIDRPFWSRELPNPADVIKGELAERGEWIVANIQPNASWPVNAQRVEWRGYVIWVTVQRVIDIPDINVELFDKPPYEPLQRLTPRGMERDEQSKLHIAFSSPDENVRFRVCLDFAAERLLFSPFTDVGVRDTGSAASARRVREVRRFEQELFGNGRLKIVNADTGQLISWKSAYIPLNMFQDAEGCAAQLAMWDRAAEKRQDFEDRYAARLEWFGRGYSIHVLPKA